MSWRYFKPFGKYELINSNFALFSRFFVTQERRNFFKNFIFGEYFFFLITHLDPKGRTKQKIFMLKWNTLVYTVMRASFFSWQMALHFFVLIWRKGYLTPLYLCLFFFLFTNLFLQIHPIFPPFLKEKNRNNKKY